MPVYSRCSDLVYYYETLWLHTLPGCLVTRRFGYWMEEIVLASDWKVQPLPTSVSGGLNLQLKVTGAAGNWTWRRSWQQLQQLAALPNAQGQVAGLETSRKVCVAWQGVETLTPAIPFTCVVN